MNYTKLVARIAQTFRDQDSYYFDKHVPEFAKQGVFLADYFNQLAVEPLGEMPPRFYHTFSPFDVISNTSPQQAVVFEAGRIIVNESFDDHVAMRTAAMSAVVLLALGTDSLADKRVLLMGSGRIATQAAVALATVMGLREVDVINQSGDLSTITASAEASGLAVRAGNIDHIAQYDVIICHTQASEALFSVQHLEQIKPGAVLASFISSTEHGEFPDEVYDATKANIIADWDKTIAGAKDMQRAKAAGLFESPIYLKDVLVSSAVLDRGKQYTVYRSTGTPIQNMAILKTLIESRQASS